MSDRMLETLLRTMAEEAPFIAANPHREEWQRFQAMLEWEWEERIGERG